MDLLDTRVPCADQHHVPSNHPDCPYCRAWLSLRDVQALLHDLTQALT